MDGYVLICSKLNIVMNIIQLYLVAQTYVKTESEEPEQDLAFEPYPACEDVHCFLADGGDCVNKESTFVLCDDQVNINILSRRWLDPNPMSCRSNAQYQRLPVFKLPVNLRDTCLQLQYSELHC